VKLDSKSRNSEAARRGEKPYEWCSFGSVPPYIGVWTIFRIRRSSISLYANILYVKYFGALLSRAEISARCVEKISKEGGESEPNLEESASYGFLIRQKQSP
jgi:hypothetical protein